MGDGVETLLRAIPEGDQYCSLKRAEIRRWHQSCGVKVLNSKSEDIVASILNDEILWNGYKINRFDFGQRVLNDTKGIMNDYDHCRLSCLLCSKEKVREYFLRREKELNRSIEDLVTRSLGRFARTKLENFWSHYANIVDVNDPSPVIVESFKKMMSAKGLSSDNQNDIWRYGFMCAKEEGSIDALGFFSGKLLQGRHEQKDRFLIDTIANINFINDRNNSASRVIEFCVENLNSNRYKDLVEEMVRTKRLCSILSVLIDVHLYNSVKQLIKCFNTEDISAKEYGNLLSIIGYPISPVPEESKKFNIGFFTWLWEFAGFAKHRVTYLNDLDGVSSLPMLTRFVEVGELELLRLVIGSAKPEQIRKAVTCLGDGRFLCRALYQKNERLLLSQVLSCVRDGRRCLSNLDSVVYDHLKCTLSKQKNISPDKVFELYTKGKREELLEYVEPIVQTRRGHNQPLYDVDILVLRTFSDMLEEVFEFKEVNNPDQCVLSSLDDIKRPSCSTATTRNRRK